MIRVCIFIVFTLFITKTKGQNNTGVSDYNAGYKKINVRQTAESNYEKERKKLRKYFEKQEYNKANEYTSNVATKTEKEAFILLGDNYFLKGKEKLGMDDFLEAIDFYNKALLFYKKGDYNKESQFVKRDIGICYINLLKKDRHNEKLIENAYYSFKESNSFDLIERYDHYFASFYLKQYTNTLDISFLDKAYLSCYNNQKIDEFSKCCSNVAKTLFQQFNRDKNNKTLLERSILLFKKLNDQENLNIAYESLANYYIDNTIYPERAYDYLNRIITMTTETLDKYTVRINKKLLSYCKTVDDCLELATRKPELKQDTYNKAIIIAVSMEDFDKLYRYYPSKKSDIKTNALLNIKTIDDCKEAYNYFPSKKKEISFKALKIANNYQELGNIAEIFNNIASEAETKALYNIKTIDDKKEFITYFPNSTYGSVVQKEIDIEEGLGLKLEVVKKKINGLIINTYSDGKQSSQTSSELNYSEEMEKVITLTYSFEWVVYFNTRPIGYNIDFNTHIYLNNDNITFSNITLLMDDDPQELDELIKIEPLIKLVFKSLVQDYKILNNLKSKREISSDLPDYYKFSFDIKATDKEDSYHNQQSNEDNDNKVFDVVETMPEFPGGRTALMYFLANNIHYPDDAKMMGIQGRVFINFVVETDGSITNIKILRGIGSGCDEEAARVVKIMPKWSPGLSKGKPVRVSFNLPVKFTLTN